MSYSEMLSSGDLSGKCGMKRTVSVASWPCTARPTTAMSTVPPLESGALTVSWASTGVAASLAVPVAVLVVVGVLVPVVAGPAPAEPVVPVLVLLVALEFLIPPPQAVNAKAAAAADAMAAARPLLMHIISCLPSVELARCLPPEINIASTVAGACRRPAASAYPSCDNGYPCVAACGSEVGQADGSSSRTRVPAPSRLV